MSHFGPSMSEKVIYHRLFGSENGNLAPILTKFGIFRWFLTENFYPDTKMPTSVRTSVLLASSIFAKRRLVSACNNLPSVLPDTFGVRILICPYPVLSGVLQCVAIIRASHPGLPHPTTKQCHMTCGNCHFGVASDSICMCIVHRASEKYISHTIMSIYLKHMSGWVTRGI
jgi:hypothetical protein